MGSSVSKPARQLPKTAKPTWAGARTPHPSDPAPTSQPGQVPPRPSLPNLQASEVKNEAIEMDSQDPHLLQNLSRLGPVNVDHHMRTVRPATVERVNRSFQTRIQSELEARSPRTLQNRLVASSLSELLDRRREVKSPQELEQLAKQYNIDLEKLEKLARFVNSVSIDENSVTKTLGEDGVETTKMKAEWVDPPFRSWASNANAP
ncbi:hypothetical protein K474DRAFT_1637466 [Panus rudis PR-1116 ss-1]|nr:hypothetical protein K474DRAFT_1637466 [Panus rudis PR-1116 ss-1]